MTDSKQRPKTTSAQRQAALRQRARALAQGLDEARMRSAPDTALLEALPAAYRLKQAAVIEDLVIELLRRLDVHVTLVRVNPPAATVPAAVSDPEVPDETVTVTQSSETKVSTRTYPVAVQRMAVELADRGATSREVREAILKAEGRAPASSNLAKMLRLWRSALSSDT
jgi:hypothetical protein